VHSAAIEIEFYLGRLICMIPVRACSPFKGFTAIWYVCSAPVLISVGLKGYSNSTETNEAGVTSSPVAYVKVTLSIA
jgi:hypothetical protein